MKIDNKNECSLPIEIVLLPGSNATGEEQKSSTCANLKRRRVQFS
ncbi:hypothetical protein [Sphingobium psychrophilum]|nr:hypothetical protein [Sphingobium psychrophilum]